MRTTHWLIRLLAPAMAGCLLSCRSGAEQVAGSGGSGGVVSGSGGSGGAAAGAGAGGGAAGVGGSSGTGAGSPGSGGAAGGDPACYRDPYLPNVYSPPCEHPVVEAHCVDELCRIPAGCFIAGAPWCEVQRAKYSENPTQVTFTHDLWIGRTEVTQKQWKAAGFADPSPSDPSVEGAQSCVADDCPVSRVTWFEAVAFTNTLSARAGFDECYELQECTGTIGVDFDCASARSRGSIYECNGYRLPTVPEWEYAARAGTKTAFYSGDFLPEPKPYYGCEEDPALEQIAWYCHNSETPYHPRTHPVAQKLPNGWGLYDVIGNVNEWIGGPAYPSFADLPPQVDPRAEMFMDGTPPKNAPGARGGEVALWPSALRVAFVWPYSTDTRHAGIGFRLARTVTTP